MDLAERTKTLTPSATLAITAKAKELKAQGVDVIGLGAGEPDFNTPDHIIEAAYHALLEGKTKYTATGGLEELKQAIIDKLLKDQGLKYDSSEIIVTNGAKHALYTLFQALLNDGDEVIIPAPYWVSYTEQVKLAGGVPVIIETNETTEFKMTASQLKAAITKKTKAIIINSPSNPTGMCYSESELLELGNICLQHNLLIVSDEIYEKLVYDGQKHISIAQLSERLKQQTVIINGLSKAYSMTGWRIGYAVGNKELIKQMTSIASHSTSNPTTHSQYGAIAALNGPQDVVEKMRIQFEKRLEKFHEALVNIPGITCIKPKGAFYLFPNVKEAATLCGYHTVDEFATALLTEAHVAVVPGTGFGAPDCIRVSYATSEAELIEAANRIKKFVEEKMEQ
ncbi:pyridoxal phosphate-dependent aminotransferase [Pallidibacillus thermolactis]|jgi:aspartate aminotransferase|uniref:pyridoxal phosphate-dependent aminotransferase n=1 Tax=Pallidibacillus thermolactis TaxID=251051 RepID=UPI00156BABC4|nr:pyridoxal phosphate-dependent aminotransferase [Pallidibacillus thermolactis]MCU9599827.1 pyridoxal phosphate-dependent aminotransferase [Pallidibacillus thermolactis subsp. kokeshiiformis]